MDWLKSEEERQAELDALLHVNIYHPVRDYSAVELALSALSSVPPYPASDKLIARSARGGIHATTLSDWGLALIALMPGALAIFQWRIMTRPPIYGHPQPPSLTIALAILLLPLMWAIWFLWDLSKLRHKLATRLEGSGLDQLIAQGPEEVNAVSRAIPEPWKTLVARPAKTVKQAVMLAVKHAEWFISPRPRYVNPAWVFGAIGAVLLLVALGATLPIWNIQSHYWHLPPLTPYPMKPAWLTFYEANSMLTMSFLMVGQAMLIASTTRGNVSTAFVIRYLRSRFVGE